MASTPPPERDEWDSASARDSSEHDALSGDEKPLLLPGGASLDQYVRAVWSASHNYYPSQRLSKRLLVATALIFCVLFTYSLPRMLHPPIPAPPRPMHPAAINETERDLFNAKEDFFDGRPPAAPEASPLC